jgi:hypothetical protein
MKERMGVIPAQAGPLAAAKPIHGGGRMDSRLRGNDKSDVTYPAW